MATVTSAEPPRIGLCLDCNYALQGLFTHRCPECGRAFDPADPQSFNPGRPIPSWAAWAAGPISLPVCVAVLLGVGVTLWRARLPSTSFTAWRSPVMLGWLALAVVWLAWPVVRRGVLVGFGWPSRVIQPMPRGHWVVPIVVAAMVLLACRQLPRRLAFRGSEPAMAALAQQVMAQPHGKFDNRWVGAYPAKNIHAVSGGMRFTVQDDDVQFKAGFEYLPTLDPKHAAFRAYHYMGNGWWSWRDEG